MSRPLSLLCATGVLVCTISQALAQSGSAQELTPLPSASAPQVAISVSSFPSASAVRATPSATSSGVLVDLRADDPNAVLQVRPLSAQRNPALAGVEGWVPACAASCGVLLDPSLPYRVGGAGLASSDSFYLPKGHNHVAVEAAMKSSGREIWGESLVLTGASTLLLGAIVLATVVQAGASKNSETFDHVILPSTVTTMAIGAILLGIGVPLRVGASTSCTVTPAQRAPRGAPKPDPKAVSLGPQGIAF